MAAACKGTIKIINVGSVEGLAGGLGEGGCVGDGADFWMSAQLKELMNSYSQMQPKRKPAGARFP